MLDGIDNDGAILQVKISTMHNLAPENPATALNRPAAPCLDLLLSRRSGSAKSMIGPGPSRAQIRQILGCGTRVPDHGKLAPWRFIVFEGEGRVRNR